jgi:hypothetical protein
VGIVRATLLPAILLAVSPLPGCDPPPPPEPSASPWDAPPHVEAELLEVIQDLFDVIEHRDLELGREILHPGGRFVSIRETEEGTVVREQSHDEFLESMAREGPAFLERFWDPEILYRGDLAVVWTPYDFWVDGERSHCGVDAFTLVRGDDGWRIAATVYTVEVTGCDDEPLRSPLGLPEWDE